MKFRNLLITLAIFSSTSVFAVLILGTFFLFMRTAIPKTEITSCIYLKNYSIGKSNDKQINKVELIGTLINRCQSQQETPSITILMSQDKKAERVLRNYQVKTDLQVGPEDFLIISQELIVSDEELKNYFLLQIDNKIIQ